MKYDPKEQELIRTAFEALTQRNVRYVVPRWYDALPEGTPGGDIDLLVDPEALKTAETCLAELGFSRNKLDRLGGARNKLKYYKEQLADMMATPAALPRRFVRFAGNRLRSAATRMKGERKQKPRKTEKAYKDVRVYQGNVMIHMVNHLAYASTLNRKLIMTDDRVVQSMLANRQTREGVAHPAPADELVHLVCRGVFDRFGSFPDYYLPRCRELHETIRSSDEEEARLRELLEIIFFKAWPVVHKGLQSSEYNELRQNLRRFAGY